MRSRYSILILAALAVGIALIAIGSSPRRAAAVAVVDATSCQDPDSCTGLGADAVIGPDSCNAAFACDALQGTVGEGSCNGFDACFDATGDIGDGSCNNDSSCHDASGVIGDGSCDELDACGSMSGTIGDGSCNGLSACHSTSIEIGNGSCNGDIDCFGQATPVGDCEENTVSVPQCNLTLAKSASPTVIPATGGTSVTYTVRIDFLEDESLNSIEDDQYPALDPAVDCELFDGDTDTSLGAVTLPDDFIGGDYILCEYAYAPPAAAAGDEYVNVVTINAGTDPDTSDVSEDAAVTYVAVVAEPTATSTPDFEDDDFLPTATPTPTPTPTATPLPTATPEPTATQLSAAVAGISPPATGDGGLR
jgi:hypothetical protein